MVKHALLAHCLQRVGRGWCEKIKLACKQKNIAVLNEDRACRNRISDILREHHRLRSFDSSESLQRYLESNDVQLLVLSANLTRSYCLSVLLEIGERWPGLPIVVTSDDADQYDRIVNLYARISKAVVLLPSIHKQFPFLVDDILEECPYSTFSASTRRPHDENQE